MDFGVTGMSGGIKTLTVASSPWEGMEEGEDGVPTLRW